jgi:ribosome-associated protein
METLSIHTPFIQLNQALKLLGWVESGSMANEVIDHGLVTVNQVQEYRRRNKLYPGMVIEFEGQTATVVAESN